MLTASSEITIEKSTASSVRVGIVRSLFNTELTASLERACRQELLKQGVAEERIAVFSVPGALEIPVTAQALAKTGQYDVLIALGLVMKGETYHFELVADECARGCMEVALTHNVPVIMEVLAAYTKEQAVARCSDDEYNKGIEAAQAALQSFQTLVKIRSAHV